MLNVEYYKGEREEKIIFSVLCVVSFYILPWTTTGVYEAMSPEASFPYSLLFLRLETYVFQNLLSLSEF